MQSTTTNAKVAAVLDRLQDEWDDAEAAYLDARLSHSPQLDRLRDKSHEARAAYRAARMMAKELGAL